MNESLLKQRAVLGQMQGANFANAPAREADVPAALSKLEAQVEEISRAIAELGARLAPITRNEPTDTCKEGLRVPRGCALSQRIEESSERLLSLTQCIHKHIGLLEI